METIEIALAANEKYLSGMIVSAGSIAMKASINVILSFNILDSGISETGYNNLVKIVKNQHPHVRFTRHKIDETIFKKYPQWKDNYMAYARLLLGNLLPNKDYVIYCDVDFIWVADIYDLWIQRNKNIMLLAVHEPIEQTLKIEEEWFKSHNLPFNKFNYICSGLCFFNLRLMREEQIFDKLFDFLNKNVDVIFPDQAAINSVLYKRIKLLDPVWMQIIRCCNRCELNSDIVFHYSANIPPWLPLKYWTDVLSDITLLWHRVYGHLHNQSTFWSLKKHLPLKQIILARTLCKILQIKFFRRIFFYTCLHTGRRCYIRFYLKWNLLQPFNYKNVKINRD